MSERLSDIPAPLLPVRFSDSPEITSSNYHIYQSYFKKVVPFETAVGRVNPYTGEVVSSMDDYLLYCHCYYLKAKTEAVLDASEKKVSSANADAYSYRSYNQKLKKRNSILFYITVTLLLISSFVVILLISNLTSKSSNLDQSSPPSQSISSSIAYASGYDDALHGIRPSVYDVKCYSCGSSYSDYTEIHFFEVSSAFVPICESCVMDHDISNPIVVFGEKYSFEPVEP